jgi:hypothetical protein
MYKFEDPNLRKSFAEVHPFIIYMDGSYQSRFSTLNCAAGTAFYLRLKNPDATVEIKDDAGRPYEYSSVYSFRGNIRNL